MIIITCRISKSFYCNKAFLWKKVVFSVYITLKTTLFMWNFVDDFLGRNPLIDGKLPQKLFNMKNNLKIKISILINYYKY